MKVSLPEGESSFVMFLLAFASIYNIF